MQLDLTHYHQVRKHGDTQHPAYSEDSLQLRHHNQLSLELREDNTENEDIEDDTEDNVGIVSSYFKCHLCDEDFITRDHVIAHIEHEHQDAYNEDKDVYEQASKMNAEIKKPPVGGSEAVKEDEMCRRVNCIFCPCQFVSTNELRKHVLAHVNNKPFACDICHKKFTIKQALMRHKKKHDSGVSSEDENSEEDLPHYRHQPAAAAPRPGLVLDLAASTPGHDSNSETSGGTGGLGKLPAGTKRANLMDTINKLSAAAASADKKSTLDQLFGSPASAIFAQTSAATTS